MKKRLLSQFASILAFVLLMCFSVENTLAQPPQSVTVSGKVIGADNSPILGASIYIQGTTQGTTTDLDGRFTISAPNQRSVIVISYMGMGTQEISVSNVQGPLTVMLTSDDNVMDQVIVTGYGTIKKSAYAGSASVIRTDQMADVPAISMNQMLAGNASGVTVTNSSNQPGGASQVRIRGMGSMNAGNNPIYVVDGIVVTSGDVGNTDAGLDLMSTINPNDIENIAVIKDAAAASLYGSRAANGVILITTKQGKKGKPSIGVKMDWGFTDFAMPFKEILNGEERRQAYWDGYYYSGINGDAKTDPVTGSKIPMSDAEAREYADSVIDACAPIPWSGYEDWSKALFQKGSFQSYEVTASGATDKMRFFSSVSITDQDGVARKTSGFRRISGRVNVDYMATDKLTLGAKIQYSKINQEVFTEGTTYTSPFYASRKNVTPNEPIYNEDGSYNQELLYGKRRNPVLAMEYNYRHQDLTRAFNTLYAEYAFIPELKLRTTFSNDFNLSEYELWYDNRTSDGEGYPGYNSQTTTKYNKWVWSTSLAYEKRIKDHRFDLLAAHDLESYDRKYVSANGTGYLNPDYNALSNAATPRSVGGYGQGNRMESFIFRGNYDYQNKYFAGASMRIDRSSKLPEDNRAATFWSVSGAWRIKSEDFMQDVNALSDLRLRASYGTNATLPSGNYAYWPLTSVGGSYMGESAMSLYQLDNYNLGWEKNYNLNIGLDIGLFKRVTATVEYYNRKTTDLLYSTPITALTGFTSLLTNFAEMRNTGFEVELFSTNIAKKDFTWTTTFTIGHNKNKILRLDGEATQSVGTYTIRRVGLAYNTWYVFEFAGIDPQTGEPLFYKNTGGNDNRDTVGAEELGTENGAVKIPYKSFDANVSGGLTNTLRYKWLDLSFLFTYQFGGYSYDSSASKLEHGGEDLYTNIPVYYKDRWMKPGDEGKTYERFWPDRQGTPMSSIYSTRRIHSTDFIRLKNVTIGFTFPKSWTDKIGVGSARIYASAQNAWTWAAWDWYDPESVGSSGVVEWAQPPLKTWTFGIDFKF